MTNNSIEMKRRSSVERSRSDPLNVACKLPERRKAIGWDCFLASVDNRLGKFTRSIRRSSVDGTNRTGWTDDRKESIKRRPCSFCWRQVCQNCDRLFFGAVRIRGSTDERRVQWMQRNVLRMKNVQRSSRLIGDQIVVVERLKSPPLSNLCRETIGFIAFPSFSQRDAPFSFVFSFFRLNNIKSSVFTLMKRLVFHRFVLNCSRLIDQVPWSSVGCLDRESSMCWREKSTDSSSFEWNRWNQSSVGGGLLSNEHCKVNCSSKERNRFSVELIRRGRSETVRQERIGLSSLTPTSNKQWTSIS